MTGVPSSPVATESSTSSSAASHPAPSTSTSTSASPSPSAVMNPHVLRVSVADAEARAADRSRTLSTFFTITQKDSTNCAEVHLAPRDGNWTFC